MLPQLCLYESVGSGFSPSASSAEGFGCMMQDTQRICFTTLAAHQCGACPLVINLAAMQQCRVTPTLSRLTACTLCAALCNSCKLVRSPRPEMTKAEAVV